MSKTPSFLLRLFLALFLGGMSSLSPKVAKAETQQVQEMKFAYSEGYAAYKQGAYKKAIAYFTQAYRLAPQNERYQKFRATMAFFLASSYAQLKERRVTRRWLRLYRESKHADPRFRKEADALWKRVRPRFVSRPVGPTPPPKRVDPPTLEEIGKERLFTLPPPRPVDKSPSIEELQRRLKDPNRYKSSSSMPPMQLAAVILMSVGGVALLVGASTHIAAASQDGEARSLFSQGPQASVPAKDISSRLESARGLETASLIVYGVAILLAGSGVALFFLAPKPTPKPAPNSTLPAPPRKTPAPSKTNSLLFSVGL
ncbi:MAG: hypothetical protein H6728_13215 [Myxococcales bacterium]|nr:hypothetical protein [Myxococcales bacterium]MCB9644029.1 hypothetical protein [Myxococcales bacterium]